MGHLMTDWPGAGSIRSSLALAGLADAEHQDPGAFVVGYENVAGLAQQIGNVDGGQGISECEHERVARNELGEHLAGLERRQGAAQSAQIERLFGHARSRARSGACVKSARLTVTCLPAKVRCVSPFAHLARESCVM